MLTIDSYKKKNLKRNIRRWDDDDDDDDDDVGATPENVPSRLTRSVNPLKAELNPICHLLALLGAHHIFHVGGLRFKAADGT